LHSVIHEAFLAAIHGRSNNFSDESHIQQANVIKEGSNDIQINCSWHALGEKLSRLGFILCGTVFYGTGPKTIFVVYTSKVPQTLD
jgi:hypothetical protein